MNKVILTLGAAALAFTSAAAFAGEKKMSIEDKFNKVDTNSDGVITEAEFTAQGERATAEKFAKMAGDDGELTMDELKAYYKKKHKEHDKKYKKEKSE